ncbi:MAG TPA: right-handed parallel beta-helix repeat-containing protein [Alphaproteobacteria bacterium]|nr:right-handed parallel beta-helix repeat-containing protein [Alphaproteobacteria bacterium]
MRSFFLCSVSAMILAISSPATAGGEEMHLSAAPKTMEEAMALIAQLQSENEELRSKVSLKEPQRTSPAQQQEEREKQVSQKQQGQQNQSPPPEPASPAPVTFDPFHFKVTPKLDTYVKLGNERTIGGAKLFYPLSWNGKVLTYSDTRLIGDSQNELEGNIGLGIRYVPTGKGLILGTYGFFDHRKSQYDNVFSQATFGAELLTENYDFRANYYQSLSSAKTMSETTNTTLRFTGSSLVADQTINKTKEIPLSGFDVEAGIKLPLLDTASIYGGAFHFYGDDAESLTGVKARARWRLTDWLELGAEHQNDNVRGATNFAEIRLRFPLGETKHQPKPAGIYARLDEDVIRDIDIVTQESTESRTPVQNEQVINSDTNSPVVVHHVDNEAAGGGDGSAEHPYNTLSAAAAASNANEMIYVHAGDGTSTGQSNGITLNKTGQKLIGSGTSLTLASLGLKLLGVSSSTVILPKTTAPIVSNSGGNGVTVSANDVQIGGITVESTTGHGIYISNANNVKINNVSVNNIGNGTTDYGIYALYTTAGPWTLDLSNDAIANSYNTGIYVRTQNAANLTATIENNTVRNAGSYGIYARSEGTSTLDATIRNNTLQNNVSRGLYLNSITNSNLTATIEDNIITDNNSQGIYLQSQNFSTLNAMVQNNELMRNASYAAYGVSSNDSIMNADFIENTITDNNSYGLYLNSQTNSIFTTNITDNLIDDNSSYGMYLYAQSASQMNPTITGNTITDNSNIGMYIYGVNSSVITSVISDNTIADSSSTGIYIYGNNSATMDSTLRNNLIDDNSSYGVYLRAATDSIMSGMMEENTVTGNSNYGVFVDDDSTVAATVDMGGGALSSTGNNRIFGNSAQEIRVDLNGNDLKAENNWWGTSTGLSVRETTLDVGSTIDTHPHLTTDPAP